MSSKYTPGPWHVAIHAVGDARSIRIVSESGSVIALAKHAHGNKEENAALLSASPSVLAALKKAMKMLAWDDPAVFQDGAEEARAAVAKAEGFP